MTAVVLGHIEASTRRGWIAAPIEWSTVPSPPTTLTFHG
jgi:hypothetical protein